ncbi:Xaa-Pro peptidase family protein [Aquamicrobium sp. LC103]|uniref:M24 family metallopeptidase n=1 Tax=Aquamicrobium sp. LC103 TaxID=1120658 RepID=UPI0024849EE3|nr:Xaa-Pro peptidase family protein [Aquamicrobium sp. LC103]
MQEAMAAAGVDLLLVTDANHIYWLTGAEDWAFYTPLYVLVSAKHSMPFWYGRAMDRPGAQMSTWLDADHVIGYPEDYVQQTDRHPSDHLVGVIADLGHARSAVGYESESYYFSIRAFDHLRKGLPNARFLDCDLLVNRLRMEKSDAEIAYMRDAAGIAARTMSHAMELIAPGVRQSEVMAEIFKTQIAPDERFGGTITGLSPIILAGEKAATAHPAWNDDKFESGQTIALELGGARRRYCSGLARTMHLGTGLPDEVRRTEAAVEEGMQSVLECLRAGIEAQDVHAAWQKVLDRHGLKKDSRIGYGIGVGFPPDWGERAVSLRRGDNTILKPNMTFHIILGMWMEGWGLELSETVRVTTAGFECLTQFPHGVRLKG